MADLPPGLKLPAAKPEILCTAVRAVLEQQSTAMPAQHVEPQALIGRLPSATRLREGAAETIREDPTDAQAAEYFQSLLELGYLVASADGLVAEERDALALLVKHATDSVVDNDVLQLHFRDLDAACEVLGRRERLSRVAANFDSPHAQHEALSFAALAAIADGTLAPSEMAVLLELGEHFKLTAKQVEMVVDSVATSIRHELEGTEKGAEA